MIEITAEYLASQGLSETFPQRFWSYVKKTDSCWIWTGALDGGYGSISTGIKKGRSNWRAHRGSWVLHRGPIPKGVYVLHDCPNGDNPACVNPDHLWLGTLTENNRDKIAKGRSCFGERHPARKLSWIDVDYIRTSYDARQRTQQELSVMFGTTISNIANIVNFKKWVSRHGPIPNSFPLESPNIVP